MSETAAPERTVSGLTGRLNDGETHLPIGQLGHQLLQGRETMDMAALTPGLEAIKNLPARPELGEAQRLTLTRFGVNQVRDAEFRCLHVVFEGEDQNTPDKLAPTQARYGLKLPFGHDPPVDGWSTVMCDYQTGGTPWFIVIDPEGRVRFGGFQLDPGRLFNTICQTSLT